MAEVHSRWTGHPYHTRGSSLAVKTALVVGYLALAAGILRAHQAQPLGYEVSIYAATPVLFWLCIGVALSVSVAVVASGYYEQYTPLTLLLAGSAMLAIVSLPIIRGYHFFGREDSLTHLGWTREILGSITSPFELIYPGAHLFSGATQVLLGIADGRAVMLTVPLFVLVYFVFFTLVVRALIPRTVATILGAFVAFLLLPVFNVGTKLMFFPFILGVFLSPLFVYLLVLYLRRDSERLVRFLPVTALDLLLLLVGVTLIWVHPQLFSDVLLVLGAILVLQIGYSLAGRSGLVTTHRWIAGQFAVLSAVFVAWNLNHDAASRTLDQIVIELTTGGPASTGAVVQQRAGSLTAIGAGIPEIFLKVFLVNTLVILFAGLFAYRSLTVGSEYGWGDLDAWTRYLLLAGVLVGLNAAVHFFGEVSSYTFRHLGFGMVLASILGVAGLYFAITSWAARSRDRTWLRSSMTVGGVFVAIAVIALSVAVFFPSPYVYLASHQVSETEMEGFESAFEHRAEGVEYAGVRGGNVERYSEAIPGVPEISSRAVYGEDIRRGVGSGIAADSYFVVTETDRKREITAYRELRVTSADFQRIENTEGLSRIQANGDMEIYYVPAGAS